MLYKEAISKSIVDAMQRDPKVILLGQNITTPHGVFGTTTEAARCFPDRVIEVGVSETMLTGACVGLAMEGWKPIYVHCRADFSLLSFEHLINTAAKIPFLHGKPLPFVMRVIVGRGWGQGPVHSQSWHQLLAEVPGLQVFVPARAYFYKSYLKSAFLRPTIIFEARRLYESESEDSALGCLADQGYQRPDITIVTIGDAMLDAKEAIVVLKQQGIRANYFPWEELDKTPTFTHPKIVVDIAPNSCADVAPPFMPQGVSQVFQRLWYPTANDIVEAACKMLGKEPPARKEPDGIYAPVGSAF